jgi:hypothetical protein
MPMTHGIDTASPKNTAPSMPLIMMLDPTDTPVARSDDVWRIDAEKRNSIPPFAYKQYKVFYQ